MPANTNLLIMGEKQEAFHLTFKTDWLNCINKTYRIPSGPRLYLGFIFYH